MWQLWRAKQFTHFKAYINNELKRKVIDDIKQEMILTRSETLPNNDCHQQATIVYWTASIGRILQAALMREIITDQWLKAHGYYRHSRHLFFIEQDKLH